MFLLIIVAFPTTVKYTHLTCTYKLCLLYLRPEILVVVYELYNDFFFKEVRTKVLCFFQVDELFYFSFRFSRYCLIMQNRNA